MLLVAAVAILATMTLALTRAILGPSVYDRVLAVNMFGTKTVLLLSIMAFAAGRTDFLDLALAYALINFIGVLAVLWFVKDNQQHQLRRSQSPSPATVENDALDPDIHRNTLPAVQEDHLPAVQEDHLPTVQETDKS